MLSELVQSRPAQREATRQKVLAAAEHLFRGQGFAATTIRQIAAVADVSVGTVMAVGDKSGLLVTIFENWIGAVHRGRADNPVTARTRLASDEAVDAVMGVFEPFIGYFTSDPELSREYVAIIARGTHQSVVFQQLAPSLIAEVNQVLTRSDLSDSAASRGARVIFLACLGLLMIEANGAIPQQSGIDQLREVIRFVVSPPGQQP